MIDKRSWEEFRTSGLLWWVNRTLHLFGWAIVLEYDDDEKFTEAYPARCAFRGFDRETEENGFKTVTNHIKDNMEELVKDCNE